MAKITTPESTTEPAADFDDYTPEQTKGRFDDIVEQMIAHDKSIEEKEPDAFAKGKRTRYKVLAPTDDAEKTVRQFQVSARKFNRTGRHIATEPQNDGGVLLRFVLGTRQARPRKKNTDAGSADAPVNSVADAPSANTESSEETTPEEASAA